MLVCFKVCGNACKKTCEGCEECCDEIGRCCDYICPKDKPSPIFLVFSCMINLAIIIVSAVFLGKDAGRDCSASTTRVWYALLIVIAVLNILFAIYAYKKFTQNIIENNDTACGAFGDIIMRDLGFYFYIYIIILQIVWISISGVLVKDELVCSNMADTAPGIICVAVYLGGGFVAVVLSVLHTCCHEEEIRGAAAVRQDEIDRERRTAELNEIRGGHQHNRNAPAAAAAAAPPPRSSRPSDRYNSGHSAPGTREEEDQNVASALANSVLEMGAAALTAAAGVFSSDSRNNNNNNRNNNTNSNASSHHHQQQQQQQYQHRQPQPQQRQSYQSQAPMSTNRTTQSGGPGLMGPQVATMGTVVNSPPTMIAPQLQPTAAPAAPVNIYNVAAQPSAPSGGGGAPLRFEQPQYQ